MSMHPPDAPGVAYRVAQLGAFGVMLAGLFDLAVPRLMPHHEAFLQVAAGGAPEPTAALVLLMLHMLGVALAGVGVAGLALLSAWRRTGDRTSALAAAVIVGVVATTHAWAVHTAGSVLFLGPLASALFVTIGVGLLLRRRSHITNGKQRQTG